MFWNRNSLRKHINSISHYKLLLHIQLLFQMKTVCITGKGKEDSVSSVSRIKILGIWLWQFWPINLS